MCVYELLFVCVCVRLCMCLFVFFVSVCVFVNLSVCLCMCMCMCAHTHTHTQWCRGKVCRTKIMTWQKTFCRKKQTLFGSVFRLIKADLSIHLYQTVWFEISNICVRMIWVSDVEHNVMWNTRWFWNTIGDYYYWHGNWTSSRQVLTGHSIVHDLAHWSGCSIYSDGPNLRQFLQVCCQYTELVVRHCVVYSQCCRDYDTAFPEDILRLLLS